MAFSVANKQLIAAHNDTTIYQIWGQTKWHVPNQATLKQIRQQFKKQAQQHMCKVNLVFLVL